MEVDKYPELGWFSDNVLIIRQELGLGQEAFGKLCGLSQAFISALEGRKANPSLEVISAIAKATGYTAAQLICDKPPTRDEESETGTQL